MFRYSSRLETIKRENQSLLYSKDDGRRINDGGCAEQTRDRGFYDRAKRIDLNKLRQSGVQMRNSPRKKPLEIELVYVQRL